MSHVRLLIWLYCLTLSSNTFGQNQRTADSLKSILTGVDDSTKIHIYFTLGYYESSPIQALEYSLKALELASARGMAEEMGLAYDGIAANHRIMGNKTKGFEASFKALRIFDSLGLDNSKAALLIQIGTQYTADENYEEGIFYLKESLQLFKLQDNALGISQVLLNLGESYRLNSQLDSAAYYFQEVLQRRRKVPDKVIEAYAKGNLGMVYRASGKLDLAVQHLNDAVEALLKLGDVYALAVYKSELGQVMLDQGHVDIGISEIVKALSISKKERLKEQIRDLSQILSNHYAIHGEFTKAYAYQKQYAIYQDSLINAANIRKVEQIKYNYELDEKSREIENITLKNQLSESELSQRRIQLFVVVVIGVLLAAILWIVYLAYKRNKAAKNALANKNSIISEQSDKQELLHRELHHRVKNNLQLIGSLMSLQSFNTRDKEVATAMKEGKSRVEALTLIHQSLYLNEDVTHVNFKDYLKKMCQNFSVSYQGQLESIEFNSIDINIKTDDVIPMGLVVNESICNAIKHCGDKKVSIQIDFEDREKGYALSIKDNGPGGLNWSRTEGSGHQGFGTNLIDTLTQQIGGVLDIESNSGGTTIGLTLTKSIASMAV